jgi:hypothetical protein
VSPHAIKIARLEASRFLEKCQAAEEAFFWREFTNSTGGYWSNTDTKATAALRRASMDLTRALADLRRPE